MPYDMKGLLDYARSKKNLTAVEERELAVRISRGDRAARDHLVESNMRLAFSLAREWEGSGPAQEDLVQEAMVGLNIAADKFDPDKGRFTTYATRWIRKSLYDSSYASDTIKRPSRLSRTITQTRDYVSGVPGAGPEEIADALERPLQEVVEGLDHARVVASTSDDGFREVGPDELEAAASLLELLDVDEREAISWKHGLYGKPCSLEEVAIKLSADQSVPGHFESRDAARLCRAATRKLRSARETEDDVICSVDD